MNFFMRACVWMLGASIAERMINEEKYNLLKV